MGNRNMNKNVEGYSSKRALDDWVPFHNYYMWRAYADNECDVKRKNSYPYNYKPHPYYARFDTYMPQFYKYGYGHW